VLRDASLGLIQADSRFPWFIQIQAVFYQTYYEIYENYQKVILKITFFTHFGLKEE
jgi:hypothetical protein